jgi:hypothetical protein
MEIFQSPLSLICYKNIIVHFLFIICVSDVKRPKEAKQLIKSGYDFFNVSCNH